MTLPVTAKTNKKGHLDIGGRDVVDLAEKYGTPLFVLDEDTVRKNCREYTKSFKGYPNFKIIYANKALCVKGLLKILKTESIGMDVASGGELFTALAAGCSPKDIYFHGNYKTKEEIEYALKSKIWAFVVDNLEELRSLDSIAQKLKTKARVMFRVNPGVDAHTHSFIRTGAVDSKFGITKSYVLQAVGMVLKSDNLEYLGLHAHIGSQIFDVHSYISEIDELLKLCLGIRSSLEIETKEIDLGGGIGVAYLKSEKDPSKQQFIEKMTHHVNDFCQKNHFKCPKSILEPGRSIIANAVVTLYTVGTLKNIQGVRKYAIIDGGMSDNPRFIMYGSKYDAYLASDMRSKPVEKVTIAGRACESGDVVVKDYIFPLVKSGDIIAVACTGAYNYSMASNYNKFLKPAIVSVKDGKVKELVKRQTYKQLIESEV